MRRSVAAPERVARLVERAEQITAQARQLRKDLQKARQSLAPSTDDYLQNAKKIGGAKFVIARIDDAGADDLRAITDRLRRNATGVGVVLAASAVVLSGCGELGYITEFSTNHTGTRSRQDNGTGHFVSMPSLIWPAEGVLVEMDHVEFEDTGDGRAQLFRLGYTMFPTPSGRPRRLEFDLTPATHWRYLDRDGLDDIFGLDVELRATAALTLFEGDDGRLQLCAQGRTGGWLGVEGDDPISGYDTSIAFFLRFDMTPRARARDEEGEDEPAGALLDSRH